MATTTVQDLIEQALRKLGIGSLGETLPAADLAACFDTLNVMLKSWSGRRLLTTAQIQEDFPLIGNQSAYTIGVGSNFNTTTPFRIVSAFIRDAFGNDSDLDVISREEYNSFALKTDAGLPTKLFYDPGPTQQATQTGICYFYLTPDSTVQYTVFLNSEKPFTEFTSLTNNISFPDIYLRAIIYNLALELAPEYGKTPLQDVIDSADEALSIIEAINSSNKRTVVDLGLPSTGGRIANILTGG